MIAFIFMWTSAIIYNRSFCFGRSDTTIGRQGIISKTNRLGTKPVSLVVSFIAFNIIFKSVFSLTEGNYISALLKILRNGLWSLSPIPKELCDLIPERQISMSVLSNSFFHFSDVNTDLWSDRILFGYPEYMVHQHFMRDIHNPFVDCP